MPVAVLSFYQNGIAIRSIVDLGTADIAAESITHRAPSASASTLIQTVRFQRSIASVGRLPPSSVHHTPRSTNLADRCACRFEATAASCRTRDTRGSHLTRMASAGALI